MFLKLHIYVAQLELQNLLSSYLKILRNKARIVAKIKKTWDLNSELWEKSLNCEINFTALRNKIIIIIPVTIFMLET